MATPTRAIALALTSGVTDGTTGNLTIPALTTKPATTSDSLMLVIYGCHSSTYTVSGWTAGPNRNETGNNQSVAIFYKQATSGDISGATSTTITSSFVNDQIRYGVEVITGGTFDTSTTPVGSAETSGTAITFATSALVPGTPNDLVYGFISGNGASTSGIAFSTPTGYTARTDNTNTSSGPAYSWYLFFKAKSSDSSSENPASTPTFTGTPNGGAMSMLIAFAPSTVGPIAVSGFGTFSTSSTALSVTDPNNTGTITATSGNTGIATVSPSSGTGAGPISFTVTGVATGTTTVTFSDTSSNTHVVTVQYTPAGITIRPYRDGPFARIPGMKRLLGGWSS